MSPKKRAKLTRKEFIDRALSASPLGHMKKLEEHMKQDSRLREMVHRGAMRRLLGLSTRVGKKPISLQGTLKAVVALKDPRFIPALQIAFEEVRHFAQKNTILGCFENAGFLSDHRTMGFLLHIQNDPSQNEHVRRYAQRLLRKAHKQTKK